MQTSPLIRPLSPQDAPEIDRIQHLAYGEGLRELLDALVSRIHVAPDFCFAAQSPQHASLAAYILAHPWPADASPGLDNVITSLPDQSDAIHLHDMAVDPAFGGQGIATKLLDTLIDAARQQGFHAITLVAVQDAAGFWKKRGFTPLRPAAGYDDDALFMRRSLTP
ncbi:GNAT family N-acetyltransferase [Lujinxingia litoralis]|uniref:GNAT family N-acetyltransferase n=1 Tax=Lujinxingia litoralis TaxID=2211119 RepID=A0A328C854_9DELT|nr:GNAT family N-acetyltransferase [Lujinxingia litoralis]RAL24777.1 GNAT family N-acetyltransferase [Lujinxingia litoralis]